MVSEALKIEIIHNSNIPVEEMQLLEDWTNTGLKIFLDVFQSRKSKQIHGDNTKTAKSSIAQDLSRNALGISVGTATTALLGPPCGKVVQGISKIVIGSASERLCNTILNRMNDKKRDNILTWTNTLTKKAEKEFVIDVAHGMALICVSFKDQIKSFSPNDYSKINFFNDVVRRILNFLSENPAPPEKKLTDKVIFQAFLQGRSIYKTVKWIRGLKITSAGKKWNTKEMFEECGLIVPEEDGNIKLYTKKVVVKDYNCNEFRYVYPFEDKDNLLAKCKELGLENSNLNDLKEDWRLKSNATKTFLDSLTVQFPKDLEERKPSAHDLEIKAMLEDITENLQLSPKNKLKLLENKWWPEKQVLVNSFYARKNKDGFLVLTMMKKLHEDKSKMVVITHGDKVPGLGGIGKTSTAKWFANFFEAFYDFIIWIDCGEGSLLKSFKNLARDLTLDDRNELDLCSLARNCYEKLREWKCLFIYDNAECYQGTEGIKEILPHDEVHFHCLITSRRQEGWGRATGYGEISQFQLGVFSTVESLKFLDKNIKQELLRSEYQLIQLSELLGNLPLALQLAVAALNNEKINLSDYIAQASAEDAGKIVDETPDDYQKTISKNMQISLELIKEEAIGKIAYDVLMIFGYIRPENVEQAFLKEVLNLTEETLETAVQLLIKYSLITPGGKIKRNINNNFIDKLLLRNKKEIEVDSLSIHRLVQQVIRHNEIKSENQILEKILNCNGFLDFKIVPYTYADCKIRKKFPCIRKQLMKTESLVKLLNEGRYKEAIDLSHLTNADLQRSTSLYNYAVCLEKHGNFTEALRILEELENSLKDATKTYGFYGLGIIRLDSKINKSMVYSKILNIHQLQLKLLLKERNYPAALQRSEFIHNELNSSTSLHNYALCLEKTGKTDDALEKFEYLFANTEIIVENFFSNILLVVEMNLCCREVMIKNYDHLIDLWETPHQVFILAQIMRILCNSGRFRRGAEVFNQLMKTLKNSTTKEKRNAIYYTELLRLMTNYNYQFSYCRDDEETPKIELEGVVGKSVKLKLWEFCESYYLPENLQELTLDSLLMVDKEGQKLKDVNIDHLLGPNMKKLNLISDYSFTEFIISLDLLQNIEHLNLVGCTVILADNHRQISPKEMKLNNVSFLQNDYVAVSVLVNDFVNFDYINKLSLEDCSLMIDLSDSSLNLEILYLDKINVVNWENAQWNVQLLILVDIPYVIKNQMQIQSMKILNESVGIDLRCIPQSVEKLSLSTSLTVPEPSESLSLPKLTYLTLNSYSILNIPCFASCTNLTVLKLTLEEKFSIELDSIPKTLRRIWLKGHIIEFIGDGGYITLDSLFLDSCTLCDVQYILTKFRSYIILIRAKDCIKRTDFKFCRKVLQKSLQGNILIGKFYWKDNDDYFDDILSISVNKKSEFYTFENGHGTAIDENVFENSIKKFIVL